MIPDINALKAQVQGTMSEKRFMHTLGVAKAATRIAALILPDKVEEIECAALLHDIAKEKTFEDQILLAHEYGYTLTAMDKRTPAVIHSYAAPAMIKRHFPEYATPDILSAVFNHTVGAPDMSLFDEIIFVADFIEETRIYESSFAVRDRFNEALNAARNKNEQILALHNALVQSVDSTFSHIKRRGGYINEKMAIMKNAFLKKISQLKQE